MGWRVRWTTPAWTDVEEQARFIARDSPRYAVALQREAQVHKIVGNEVHILVFINSARDLAAFLDRENRT